MALRLDNKAAWPPLLAPNWFLVCPLIFLWKLGLEFPLQSMCGLTLILDSFLLASFLPIHSSLVVRPVAESSSQLPVLVLELMDDPVALGLLDSSKVLFGRQLFSFSTDLLSFNRCFPENSLIWGAPVGLGAGWEGRTRPQPSALSSCLSPEQEAAALISRSDPALRCWASFPPAQGCLFEGMVQP